MGDLIKNFELFKKLNFDSSNQWIFYDERFQKFFDFFAENVRDTNILTEHELCERDELQQREQYLEVPERQKQMELMENENPGLLSHTESEVEALHTEIAVVEQTEEAYALLVENMRLTKHELNHQLSQLEDEINLLLNAERELLIACQTKAKQLEELQRENLKLYSEAKNCFAKMQSPPLFVHQLPLEKYFLKCDSFMQNFALYMKENFKIEEYIELESKPTDIQDIAAKLESLGKSMEYYTLEYIEEKAKAKATQYLIEQLDLTQIHTISLADMERETHELELMNEHHLKSAHETIMNDLVIHVRQRIQQRMELILYENTKQKLERALRRHESEQKLTQIISNALSNAELIWMVIQLDFEKKRNRCDNSEQLQTNALSCMQRMSNMQQLQLEALQNNACNIFLEKIADLLSQHLHQKVRNEPKVCLYEYEKFCRLQTYALQGLLNKKAYAHVLEQLGELKRVEHVLQAIVYASPTEIPMFEHVRFLRPTFDEKRKQQRIEKKLRDLRTQFHENYNERMEKDKFWRYSQLLWIWFLTEPQRVLLAIEEVKKVAAKVPTLTGVKTLGGIKRK